MQRHKVVLATLLLAVFWTELDGQHVTSKEVIDSIDSKQADELNEAAATSTPSETALPPLKPCTSALSLEHWRARLFGCHIQEEVVAAITREGVIPGCQLVKINTDVNPALQPYAYLPTPPVDLPTRKAWVGTTHCVCCFAVACLASLVKVCPSCEKGF